jgi:hypothetical protein
MLGQSKLFCCSDRFRGGRVARVGDTIEDLHRVTTAVEELLQAAEIALGAGAYETAGPEAAEMGLEHVLFGIRSLVDFFAVAMFLGR